MSSPFLFHSLDVGPRLSARKVHICRLYDVLKLSLLRDDLPRAKKAWAILARCKEMHWTTMWTIAVRILGGETFDEHDSTKKVAFLHEMMQQLPDKREMILKEIILRQIMAGHFRQALDELELYLPSFPYQDDPVLHNYAGLLSLYLSQPSISGVDDGMLAQLHFQGAMAIDSDNVIATQFLSHITNMTDQTRHSDQDSDDELMEVDIQQTVPQPQRKRVRLQDDRIS
ncbi:uncharacterized protein BT62DRAFT_1054388 [Guyanagaster necrorhizus]|uniref:Uncharacterized protein n=1 Tax=Guyanagaster necrorhizus TaxID=856835 RepID=A0A9P8AX07_9AGAR|nr:uncharacterized protein BT62DRAFT_1054388 [Guyanagaster necrorhizus MCA 3950]KAG7449437.1 hypothetical protein BT62DRAFT_1054388 [Guyanagaster necrorhizus MCA 3950]